MRFRPLSLAIYILTSAAFCSAADETPLHVGNERQLFFEDHLISTSTGLEKTWHVPQKADSPVLEKEHSWEGMGPYVYGTVIHDPATKNFKMWYNCYVNGRPDYFTCYATSTDGINWIRPRCDAVSDPRLPADNNVVMLGSGLPEYRQSLSPSVLFRPNESDPTRRYAMTYWDISAGGADKFFGLCLAFSPDGMHWTNAAENPVFIGASDVTDAQYDPIRKTHLLHYKIWRVDGEVVASRLPRGNAGPVSYWPTWKTVKLDGSKVRFQGQLVDFSSDDTSPVSGSIDFARDPTSRRVVARAESTDLVHWTNARLVVELPEQDDPADWSTYGMSTFSYETLYLGLLRVFHNDREIDLELAFSRDDRSWKRTTPGKPFIPLGPGGSYDAGMVFSSNSPIAVGDELWFYYGAFTRDHADSGSDQSASIGLAKLRRDGFVSFDANDSGGEFVTKPLLTDADQLRINAAAAQGAVSVEIRDAEGIPVPGFQFADCSEFHGDAVSQPIAWQSRVGDLGRFKGKPIRLAFRIKHAELYAFQFYSLNPQ